MFVFLQYFAQIKQLKNFSLFNQSKIFFVFETFQKLGLIFFRVIKIYLLFYVSNLDLLSRSNKIKQALSCSSFQKQQISFFQFFLFLNITSFL